MAKRLTDTDIWTDQRWFRKLSLEDKLTFYYIKDRCHFSGIWDIDCSDLKEAIGLETFDLHKFVDSVNIEWDKITGDKTKKERLKIVKKNYLLITGFLQFQNANKEGKINPEGGAVKGGLQRLIGLGMLGECLKKGYIVLTHLPEWCDPDNTILPPTKEGVTPLPPPAAAKPENFGKNDENVDKVVKNDKKQWEDDGRVLPPPQHGGGRTIDRDIDIDIDTLSLLGDNKRIGGVGEKKKEGGEKFPQMPSAKNVNGLPEQMILVAMERYKITNDIDLTKKDIIRAWENVFKPMKLQGKKFYPNIEEVYTHFCNWVQTEKFTKSELTKKSHMVGRDFVED